MCPLKKTIYINQTCKINLKNNKTKVKWTASNNKIRIVNKNSKYATIKGLKVGSAYIKAKIGKKTYRSKITIKKKVVKTPSAPTVKSYTYNRIILDNDKLQIKLAYTTSSEIAFAVYNKTDSLFKFDCEYFKLNDTDYEPDEEMLKLWNNLYNADYVDVLLIQCYSGWRPQELGLLKMENVDLENWFITGGMKTDAGKNRVVPIHPKIRSLVKYRYQEAQKLGSEYLINCTDTKTHRSSLKLTYDKYRHRIDKIIEQLELNPDHRAHDGRIQFATMAKAAEVNEYAVKRIMGHKIKDITENTYTKRKRE